MNLYTAINEVKKTVNNLLPDTLILRAMESVQDNDLAHNLEHVVSVVKHADELCRNHRPELSFKTHSMVLAGALLHDLGCKYKRETHHFISYGMAFDWLGRYGEGYYNQEEVNLIADACLQHRSSYKGELTSLISELVALADRGKLDQEEYIKRSIQFHSNNIGQIKDKVMEEVCSHVPDKFGTHGYNWGRYPKLGLKIYAKEVKAFKEFADDPIRVKQKVLEVMESMGY